MSDKDRMGVVGWLMVALVVAAIAALFIIGCADKKTTEIIRQLAPVVDKPPVECPKHQCRHGQECVPCEDGEGD